MRIPIPNATELPVEFDEFKLVSILGEGGMARVYLANSPKHSGQIAIKVLKRNTGCLSTAIEFIERFRQEGELAERILHPNLSEIYETGCLSNGHHFIAMPVLSGGTLKQKRSDYTEVNDVCRLIISVCDGVGVLHENRVVHRDIKPSNLMFRKASAAWNDVLVTDFGLALNLDSKDRLTFSGEFYGTADFASPEQIVDSKSVDTRSDIYSIGACLFWLLTGNLPHVNHAGSYVISQDYVQARTTAPPKNLRDFGDFPESLNSACRNCLQLNRDSRYQSVGELRADLAQIEGYYDGNRTSK